MGKQSEWSLLGQHFRLCPLDSVVSDGIQFVVYDKSNEELVPKVVCMPI